MTWVWLVVGAVAGSVANALIWRLPRGLPWRKGRSVCVRCGHELGWQDLLPILSFAWLRGKCRYCKQRISLRYFLVEVVLAGGFALLASPLLAATLFVTVVIAAIDWETQLVSEGLVVAWVPLVVWANWANLANWANWVGVGVGIGLIGGIWAVSRGRAMGWGDVEIAAVMGLWLGWPRVAPALWISFIAGAVYGLWLIVHSGKTMKTKIAFGPFLILGSWIAFVVDWSRVFPF